jgi:hypothetical protein
MSRAKTLKGFLRFWYVRLFFNGKVGKGRNNNNTVRNTPPRSTPSSTSNISQATSARSKHYLYCPENQLHACDKSFFVKGRWMYQKVAEMKKISMVANTSRGSSPSAVRYVKY